MPVKHESTRKRWKAMLNVHVPDFISGQYSLIIHRSREFNKSNLQNIIHSASNRNQLQNSNLL